MLDVALDVELDEMLIVQSEGKAGVVEDIHSPSVRFACALKGFPKPLSGRIWPKRWFSGKQLEFGCLARADLKV